MDKTLRLTFWGHPVEAWFQRTTNRKWHMGYQMVT